LIATPKGQKVSIALEKIDLPYDAHTINIMNGDQYTDEFIKLDNRKAYTKKLQYNTIKRH
jgi:glutathione S-transferase